MNPTMSLRILLFLCLVTDIGFVRADGAIIEVGPILQIFSPGDMSLAPCNTTTLNWVINNIVALGVPELHFITFTAAIRNNSLVEIVTTPSHVASYEVRNAYGTLVGSGSANGILTVEPFGFWDSTGIQQFEMVTWRLPNSVVLPSGWRINFSFQIHCEGAGVTTILLFPRATENPCPTLITDWTNLWQENGIWYPLQRSYDPWDSDIQSGHSFRKGWLRYKEGFPYALCTVTQTGMPSPYPPEARFTESTHTPLVGYAVYFDASGSTSGFDGDDICQIVSYRWNFGDGNITTENDPYIVHVYLTAGLYTVILNVTAPGIPPTISPLYVNWDTASAEKNVISGPHPPVAYFDYSPSSPKPGDTVTFNATLSTPDGGTIEWYYWNFSDSTPTVNETGPITTHVFALIGTYNVTLTIGDSEGLTDTTWRLVTVVSAVLHDISILSVTPNTPHEYPGRIVNITVVVKNNGEAPETFDVTAYRDSFATGPPLPVTNLGVGENTTLIFQWNTSGLTPCYNWTIKAEAPLVGDINPSDNTRTDGTVKIKMIGDLDANGIVDILDVIAAALAFGATPSDPNWNPQADTAPYYGLIDIFDLVTIAKVYGKTCP